MGLIAGHQEDQSASTRVAVWEWTIDYANSHPMGGGFDAYRGNEFAYKVPIRTGEGNTRSVTYQDHTDQARAYHSAIFEMLGEQGWPGLLLWLWIHALGLWHMERIRRRWKDRKAPHQAWVAPRANSLQLSQLGCLLGAVVIGIDEGADALCKVAFAAQPRSYGAGFLVWR